MRIIIEIDPPRPAVQRGYSTEEEIRENQRKNRLQREKEERFYQNDNSTSTNDQESVDKDKG